MAQSVRDVLGSACPKDGYVQTMKDKLGQLEKAVNHLETTIKRKSVFPTEFLEAASQRWFEKRYESIEKTEGSEVTGSTRVFLGTEECTSKMGPKVN